MSLLTSWTTTGCGAVLWRCMCWSRSPVGSDRVRCGLHGRGTSLLYIDPSTRIQQARHLPAMDAAEQWLIACRHCCQIESSRSLTAFSFLRWSARTITTSSIDPMTAKEKGVTWTTLRSGLGGQS
jgi:hypothetical protein